MYIGARSFLHLKLLHMGQGTAKATKLPLPQMKTNISLPVVESDKPSQGTVLSPGLLSLQKN